ncbi:hypothetical protein [Agromyces bauzanensis]
MSRDDEILSELQNISFVLGDLNAIRNGEYDPPRGADPAKSRHPRATMDDLYSKLGTIVGHLERLNDNIHLIREAVYGQTREESGENYQHPKHGQWGAISEAANSAENYLSTIDTNLGEIRRSGSLK